MTSAVRVATAAIASALLGLLCFEVAAIRHRDLLFDMNREIPRPASAGFYAPEIVNGENLQWTAGAARLRLNGLDRHAEWRCATRLRAPRPPGAPAPVVELAVDTVRVASAPLTGAFQEIAFAMPARSTRGATVTIASEPNWNPGGGDPRTLGVQVDWVHCEPSSRWVFPPLDQTLHAAVIPAAIGLAVVLAGGWIIDAVVLSGIVACGLAVALTSGAAPFLKYSSTVAIMSLWVAGTFLLGVRIIELIRRRPLQRPALVAAAVSAAALVLKLAALMHPSMPVGDTVFQAHRLNDVLNGQYVFRQPVGDTQFPYAIGLYVFAAPWAALTTHSTEALVMLLRVVVAASEAISGGLLYLLCAREWRRPWAGVLAVALFHLVPLPYMVVANGNLTNAFAQSAALAALCAAVMWSTPGARLWKTAGLAVLLALAFLSHITTIILLMATIGAFVVLGLVSRGDRRAAAVSLMMATALALAFSWVAYYGQFMDDYLQAFARLRAPAAAASPAVADAPAPAVAAAAPPSEARARAIALWSSRPARARAALEQTRDQLGWPLLILAVFGLRALRLTGFGTRPGHLVGAWVLVWLVFFVVGAAARVGPLYGPYLIEFLGRVNLAVYPAAVLLMGLGLASAWEVRADQKPLMMVARAAVIVLFAFALRIGSDAWLAWVR